MEKCSSYAVVAWWDIRNIALARSKLERLQKAASITIAGAIRTISAKVLAMLLDLPTFGMAVESVALMAAISPTEVRSEKPRNRT